MEKGYLLWIVFIICIFLVWFFSHQAKHKERLMLIEKGLPADEIMKKDGFRFPWLKLGIIVLGLGIALLIISFLSAMKVLDNGGGPLPLAIIAVLGGISLMIANYVNDGKNKP
jgi:hypothetical protein